MAGEEEKKRVMMPASSGYCYSDASSTENPQIYNLTAAMEIIGFPSKNLINNNQPINHLTANHQASMLSALSWNQHQQHNRLVVDDSSLRSVFSGDGNERPSQGSLSLSLTSSDHTNTNLQSFELRRSNDSRFGQSNSMSVNHLHMMQQQFQIRSSKYQEPAKELLDQLCNLGTAESKMKDNSAAARTQSPPPLPLALDLLELQRRKTKLFQMLQEVEARYKHYCDQMKSVVSSFESVAGEGAAAAYSSMASRAMSRHFRWLKDGIVSQMKATSKAMREKDGASSIPGATKGETPRLRILDVKLRQQRAFQQMGAVENHPWRPQRGLPEKAVAVLRAWLFEHFLHPYPSEVDKRILARQTGLSRSQVSNWFINARVRLWKPMVEEMYMEDQKEEENPDATATNIHKEDRKPTQDQLLMKRDSDCLSSILHTPNKNTTTTDGRAGDEMQFDFSSYTHHGDGGGLSYLHQHEVPHHYGGGVSLTLGLQAQRRRQEEEGGGGVSITFTPFYTRNEMEDQYSMFESDNQNLQYRNLMGEQLLHDLAG